MIYEAFGIALLVVQTVLLVPIITKIRKSGSGDGISLAGETIWVVAGVGWLVYGAATASTVLIVSGSIAAAGSAVVALMIGSGKSDQERRMAGYLALMSALGIFGPMAMSGVDGLSVGLSIFGVFQFLPQIVESAIALRQREPMRGVSATGAALRTAYTAGWALYAGAWMLWGFAPVDIDWPLVAWGSAGAVAFGMQTMSAVVGRSRAQNDPPFVLTR